MTHQRHGPCCGVQEPDRIDAPKPGAGMRRREFLVAVGSAAAWPGGALAQRPERMRRVGVVMPVTADDQEGQARFSAFMDGLQQLGWVPDRNVKIDVRWRTGNPDS